MTLDSESFDILLSSVEKFIHQKLVPQENYLEEYDDCLLYTSDAADE